MNILNHKAISALVIAALLASATGVFYRQNKKLSQLSGQLTTLQIAEKETAKNYQQQIDALIKESKDSKKQLDGLIADYAKLQNKPPEVVRQEIITTKSQDELLTEAVAKVTPSVVSIVITKDVPKLEVVYTNPFGNDPFFKDFGIQIPTYRQIGTEKQKVGAGTGFLVSANGYILTNRHVVADETASYTVLMADGAQKPAKVVYKDAANDIAVVKIDGAGYKSTELGDSNSLKLGESVFAVGNALGEYNNSVSKGIVSGLNREIKASDASGNVETLKGIIQTDAAINPGNSGGPLVDLDGKVIGVNVATVVGSNSIGFSIPINTVKGIIGSVVR